MVLSRVSPLAVPVLLEIGRESVRTRRGRGEAAGRGRGDHRRGDRGGRAAAIKAIHRPNAMRRRAVQASLSQTCSAPPARPVPGMTAAPIHLAGERLMLDPAGALFWPATGLLVGVGPAPGEGLVLRPPRAAAAALGHACDARPPDPAAAPLAAAHRRGARRQLPRRRRRGPPALRRTGAAERDDRGASFHLGAGQSRSRRRRAASAANGWRHSPPTTLVFRHQAIAAASRARSAATIIRRPRSRRAAARSAARASLPMHVA